MIAASNSMQPIRILLAVTACALGLVWTGARAQDARGGRDLDQGLRRESDALVEMADAAMAGRPVPADVPLDWRNDFFKARPGTFVPFTVSFPAASVRTRLALLYVRVEHRGPPAGGDRRPPAYETIYPVDLATAAGANLQLTRGFAVPPGAYRAVLALREVPDDAVETRERRAGVLLVDLDIPDLWAGGLATSTLMLADRVEDLETPVPADELDQDPYAVGLSRVHVTWNRLFGRQTELIVTFLIYNPAVAADKHFDVQVDYHLYKQDPFGLAVEPVPGVPPTGPGERYVTRTSPQRFNPSMMGGQFDPSAGAPILAGQGIPLAGFEPGAYRLAVTVTDLLSRQVVTRDVAFRVGS